MLARPNRITSAREIKEVFRRGRKKTSEAFIVWVRKRPEGRFRAVVICSKRVDKRASARNLLKRRVRETLRRDYAELLPATDVAVSIQAGAKGKSFKDLKESLHNVLSR